MANWTELLPKHKHPKLRYEECYAKVVLEELYPEEFVDLQIKDKPDLQTNDGSFGVEVTNARDENELNAEGLYTKISNNTARNKKRALEEIKKCGCKLEEGILLGKPGTDSFNFILVRFDNKLNKLNGNEYKYFDMGLLIHFFRYSCR